MPNILVPRYCNWYYYILAVRTKDAAQNYIIQAKYTTVSYPGVIASDSDTILGRWLQCRAELVLTRLHCLIWSWLLKLVFKEVLGSASNCPLKEHRFSFK